MAAKMTTEQRRAYRLENLERLRQQSRDSVRTFRKKHPRKARKQTREAQARFRQRLAESARLGTVAGEIEFSNRRRCDACGEVDPKVVRTMEKTPEALTQKVQCRGCGRSWTRVLE